MNNLAFGLFQKFFANKKGCFGLLEIAAKTKKAVTWLVDSLEQKDT